MATETLNYEKMLKDINKHTIITTNNMEIMGKDDIAQYLMMGRMPSKFTGNMLTINVDKDFYELFEKCVSENC